MVLSVDELINCGIRMLRKEGMVELSCVLKTLNRFYLDNKNLCSATSLLNKFKCFFLARTVNSEQINYQI